MLLLLTSLPSGVILSHPQSGVKSHLSNGLSLGKGVCKNMK